MLLEEVGPSNHHDHPICAYANMTCFLKVDEQLRPTVTFVLFGPKTRTNSLVALDRAALIRRQENGVQNWTRQHIKSDKGVLYSTTQQCST